MHAIHLRRADAALQDILKDGGAARKLALGLEHVEYGDKLKSELFQFSKSMETLYSVLQKLLLKKGPCEGQEVPTPFGRAREQECMVQER